MDTSSVSKRCSTCAKKTRSGKCEVLLENIGLKQDCWAWSDDPQWKKKVERAIRRYRGYIESNGV